MLIGIRSRIWAPATNEGQVCVFQWEMIWMRGIISILVRHELGTAREVIRITPSVLLASVPTWMRYELYMCIIGPQYAVLLSEICACGMLCGQTLSLQQRLTSDFRKT